MSNFNPITLEIAAANIGAFVRVHNMKGHPHAAPAKIVAVEGKNVLVQIAGADRPTLHDPRDIQFWKARNAASNIEVKIVPAGKAQPIAPAAQPASQPAPTSGSLSLGALFQQFEDAKSALHEYEELEDLCKADLEQATKAANEATKRVEDLRKQIKSRIDY